MLLFDTETTGLISNIAQPLKKQPSIIQLYVVKLNDETLEQEDEFESLFWASKIEEDATKTHGMTVEDLKGAPRFADRVDELAEFFAGEKHLFAHNLAYDRDMLWFELRRLGMECQFPWPWRHTCTVEATEAMEGFRLGLGMLHEKLFGEGFDEAHDAKADTQALARCVRELVKQGVIKL